MRLDVRALARRSVEVIRGGQAESGAYVACPTFAPYGYCWFRDGSFIADAMSRVGEADSAERFFGWCSDVITSRRERIAAGGRLHARYTLDGRDDVGEWPKRQHDGYGLWLWALRGHLDRHSGDPSPFHDAVELTTAYLERVGHEPCVDWWEEREGVHGATLACVLAGQRAWSSLRPIDAVLPDDRIDASLLVLVPLGFDGDDVVERVERELVSPEGGVHRHLDDVYYGGGEWVLLTALLGWAYTHQGRTDEARTKLEWVAARATAEGHLPEQVPDHLLHPDSYDFWMDKWGPPPCPLLWSHAMFLTLAHELGEV
ncbi:MAG: glycoside hydrolase family 15 protein [Gaiellaceae bacterium]